MFTDTTEQSLTSNVISNQNYSTLTETSNMVLNKPFKTTSAPENISTSQSEVKYRQKKITINLINNNVGSTIFYRIYYYILMNL